MYDRLGKAAIRFALRYLRRRYRRQIRIGVGRRRARDRRSPPTSPAATSPRAERGLRRGSQVPLRLIVNL